MSFNPDSLFEATNVLIKKQLESVSFDLTIEATITDAKRANDGIYTVSTGNLSFLAYSVETGYKEDEVVMVTIPQGDYDKQKMIVGKKVDKTNSPLIYKSPFQQLINVSNNLIPVENQKTISLLANERQFNKDEDFFGWEEELVNFTDSKAYNSGDKTIANSENKTIPAPALIWASGDLANTQSRYTRIGLKAQFQTWLNEYNTVQGNYGLALILGFTNADSSGGFLQSCIFDCSDFFGDPYNFETFYTQEILFDISEFKDYLLRGIRLYAYQRNNFKNTDNKKISDDYDTTGFSTTEDNIFMKDFYVCLGLPTDEFDSDIAEILTPSKKTYKKWYNKEGEGEASIDVVNRKKENTKYLNLRWIHKDAKKDIIATVEENELPGDYEIRWYRYSLGAGSPDIFAGAHWIRFYGCNNDPNDDGDYCITKESIEDEESGIEDIATNKINVTFYPNVNKASEQLKVIILKREKTFEGFLDQTSDKNEPLRVVAVSPIIEFTNENDVRSQATVIDENALSIKFDDDEKGNYFLYNRAGNISKEEDKELRTLTAVFDTSQDNVYAKPLLKQPYNSIKWIFPASGSMIIPMTSGDPLDAEDIIYKENFPTINKTGYKISYNKTNDTFEFILAKDVGDSQDYLISVGYRLMPTLNHNANRNIVHLEINKDGQLFTAQVQMHFGMAGTSGSDYTLAVIWDNNEQAFDINNDDGLTGTILLYDQNGNVIDINATNGSYEIEFDQVCESEGNVYKNFTKSVLEETEKYYPVTRYSYSTQCDCLHLFDKRYDIQDQWYGSGDSNNYYPKYWISSDTNFINRVTNSTVKLFYYNLNNKAFEETNNTDGLIYVKDKKEKIEFKAFNEAIKENYIYIDDDGQQKTISDGAAVFDENGVATYYYPKSTNKFRKAFIKYNDTYIIDPWDDFQENETYYYPVYNSEKKYDNTKLVCQKITNDTTIKNRFKILKRNSSIILNLNTDLYILKITLKNFGDYNLIAHFPIPLKNSDDNNFVIDYIEGPTDVRYSATGEVDFNKNPYQISLRCLITDSEDPTQINAYKICQGFDGEDTNNQIGHWELVYNNNIIQANQSFLPLLTEVNYDNISYKKPYLQPPAVYFKDAPLYGIKFILDYDLGINPNLKKVVINNGNLEKKIQAGTVLWTQPIYVYQDNYPSTTLNKWNGKDIVTDNETGIISANGFSAGKKESDNTFTGVVLGDWKKTDSDAVMTSQTGIYGFNHGAMAYALTDDGKAFFGKDGKGRIYLDGTKAQIYSAHWKAFSNSNKNGVYKVHNYGMMIDIDDGILDVRSKRVNNDTTSKEYNRTLIEPGNLEISIENDRTFDNSDKKILMKVSKNNYYLQSADFDIINEKGVKFDLENGKLTGYNFTLKAGTNNQYIWLKSADQSIEFYKKSGSGDVDYQKFKTLIKPGELTISVPKTDNTNDTNAITLLSFSSSNQYLQSRDYDSTNEKGVRIDLKSGKITGYTFKIQAGTSENKLIIDSNATDKPLSINSNKFYVQWNGYLYSSYGKIGGWYITEDVLSSQSTNPTSSGAVYLQAGGGTSEKPNIYGAYIKGGTIEGSYIKGGTIEGSYIVVKDKNSNVTFSVSNAGYLTATTGKIGNWFINNGSLWSSDNIYLSTTGLSMGGYFSVTPSGGITATYGSIGGWNINSNSLSNGNIHLYSKTGIRIGKQDNGYDAFSVNENGTLRIGGNTNTNSTTARFEVNGDGDVYIRDGSGNRQLYVYRGTLHIGDWTVTNTGYLQSSSADGVLLQSDGILYVNQIQADKISENLGAGSSKWTIQKDGLITATGLNTDDGNIRGKIMVKDNAGTGDYHPIYIGRGNFSGTKVQCYITWYNDSSSLAGGTTGYYVLSA